MIPKTIHFCWFGRNPKNDLIQHCINSWKKYLPDYEIIEWNEERFNINSNPYVKEAYAAKKWAFVSDVVRLHALYQQGGIYLDTDVEVFKNLDQFLLHKAFTGFEECYQKLFPVTAVMGCIAKHPIIKTFLDDYDQLAFIKNGKFDLTTNTDRMTHLLTHNYGAIINNQHQVVAHDTHIYPSYYFCKKTNDSFSCHHMDSSWRHPLKRKISKYIRKHNITKEMYILIKKIRNKFKLLP